MHFLEGVFGQAWQRADRQQKQKACQSKRNVGSTMNSWLHWLDHAGLKRAVLGCLPGTSTFTRVLKLFLPWAFRHTIDRRHQHKHRRDLQQDKTPILHTVIIGLFAHPLDRLPELEYFTTRKVPVAKRVALEMFRQYIQLSGNMPFSVG